MTTENIFFGSGSVSAGLKADWGSELRHNRVITPVDVENWAIFYTRRNAPDVMSFVQEAQRVGSQMGIHVRMPAQVALPDERTETLIKALRQAVGPEVSIASLLLLSYVLMWQWDSVRVLIIL